MLWGHVWGVLLQYSVICPALLGVPFTLITWYGFASLCVTRLLFFHNDSVMKFVIAPKSTKASVCTFLLYTQSVTGILKEVVLLHTILLQDSSTTFDFCELIEGILSSNYRSQMLYFTVPRENPIWESSFPSHLGEQDWGFPQLTHYSHWYPQERILGRYFFPPMVLSAMTDLSCLNLVKIVSGRDFF